MMKPHDFEEWLRAQPQRGAPPECRETLPQIAEQTAEAPVVAVRAETPRQVAWWTLPYGWSALAASWILIFVLDWGSRVEPLTGAAPRPGARAWNAENSQWRLSRVGAGEEVLTVLHQAPEANSPDLAPQSRRSAGNRAA